MARWTDQRGRRQPTATTSPLTSPVWAMVTMVFSVSLVLANSFGARLTGGLVTDIARFRARSAYSTLQMARSGESASLGFSWRDVTEPSSPVVRSGASWWWHSGPR